MSSTTSRKQQLRRLSPTERRTALTLARSKGLPQDWDVEWDNKRGKKIWMSPDGSRKCYSLPQALKYAVKTGQVVSNIVQSIGTSNDESQKTTVPPGSASVSIQHRKLSPEEVAQKIEEGRKNGLPEGWSVVWDNMFDQRVWISPDGKKKCKGIPQALAYSMKHGLITADKIPKKYAEKQTTNRVLSQLEVQESLMAAKEKGLPDGWNVEWNNTKQKRRWIAPDGCKVHSIPEALRMSLRKGWISNLPDSNDSKPSGEESGKTTSAAAAASDQRNTHAKLHSNHPEERIQPKSIPRRTQHIPSGNRHLTESEQLASMEEAKARGLEGGWKAEFHNGWNRRIWISPHGLKYASIANALLGIQIPNDCLDQVKKKKIEKEETKRTTVLSQLGGTNTSKAVPRKATRRKRRVTANQDYISAAKKTITSSAGEEMQVIVERDSNKSCTVTL